MPNSGLSGPFSLDENTINKIVNKISPGTYVLGGVNGEGIFIVEYVGRSDEDLNNRLHSWISEYDSFKASFFSTKKAAFDRECRIYHDFGGSSSLDNKIHPDSPNDLNLKCPYCNILG